MSQQKDDKNLHKKQEEKTKESDVIKKIIKERQKEQADNTLQKKQKDNLEELQKKEIDNLKKRLMYAIAESENIKKSLKKEIQDTKDFGVSSLVKDMLSSIESIEKAVLYTNKNKIEEDKEFKSLFDGVSMTLESIFAALKRNGVEKIKAKHEKFDHNLHQAIKTIKDEKLENGTVAEVLQDGYVIKQRLLRPAVVVVVEND